MSSNGLTNGFQSLLNLSSLDGIDVINASDVTVNDNLSLPYTDSNSILETDAFGNVFGQSLLNGQLLIGKQEIILNLILLLDHPIF